MDFVPLVPRGPGDGCGTATSTSDVTSVWGGGAGGRLLLLSLPEDA